MVHSRQLQQTTMQLQTDDSKLHQHITTHGCSPPSHVRIPQVFPHDQYYNIFMLHHFVHFTYFYHNIIPHFVFTLAMLSHLINCRIYSDSIARWYCCQQCLFVGVSACPSTLQLLNRLRYHYEVFTGAGHNQKLGRLQTEAHG